MERKQWLKSSKTNVNLLHHLRNLILFFYSFQILGHPPSQPRFQPPCRSCSSLTWSHWPATIFVSQSPTLTAILRPQSQSLLLLKKKRLHLHRWRFELNHFHPLPSKSNGKWVKVHESRDLQKTVLNFLNPSSAFSGKKINNEIWGKSDQRKSCSQKVTSKNRCSWILHSISLNVIFYLDCDIFSLFTSQKLFPFISSGWSRNSTIQIWTVLK